MAKATIRRKQSADPAVTALFAIAKAIEQVAEAIKRPSSLPQPEPKFGDEHSEE